MPVEGSRVQGTIPIVVLAVNDPPLACTRYQRLNTKVEHMSHFDTHEFFLQVRYKYFDFSMNQ